PVAGVGAGRRDQQPDLLVVVQGPDGESGRPGRLSDPAPGRSALVVRHVEDRIPLTPRQVQAVSRNQLDTDRTYSGGATRLAFRAPRAGAARPGVRPAG